MGSKIDFPISYVTDYLLYSLDDNIHFNFVKGIIEGYGENVNSLHPTGKIPQGLLVECRHCNLEFSTHQTFGAHYCPSCRKPSWRTKNTVDRSIASKHVPLPLKLAS